jgi:hypothetical protein
MLTFVALALAPLVATAQPATPPSKHDDSSPALRVLAKRAVVQMDGPPIPQQFDTVAGTLLDATSNESAAHIRGRGSYRSPS